MEGAQVVIPDLADDEFALEPAFAPGESPAHARVGSLDDTARAPKLAAPGATHSPHRQERTPGFSFPVKKMGSFASLRAVLMGGGTQAPSPAPAPASAPLTDPGSPFFPLSDDTPQQRRPSRGGPPLADVAAASNGLAHVTGLVRTPKRHGKSQSAASLADEPRSPARMPRHAHHGSHFSEHSIGGVSVSTQSSVAEHADPLVEHELVTPPLMQAAWELPRTSSPDALPAHPLSLGVPAPTLPVELALNQLFGRLVAMSDVVVDDVLSARPDAHIDEVLLHSVALQSAFAPLLDALAHVARQAAPAVCTSLLAWRALATDRADVSPRRALAVTLLVSRALIAVVQTLPAEALGDPRVDDVESAAFSMLHYASTERERERGTHPHLHRTLQQRTFEVVAQLLGELSRERIASIGGRFVQILQQANAIAGTRDTELLTESAVLGMRFLRIRVYPMEAFEEGCEFFEILARFYMHAHGFRIKHAFAHVLSAILLPVASTASVEVNHPVWADAVRTVLTRAQAMAVRPRYWSVAYPLWTAALCAAPADVFLAQMHACLDAGSARLKDRGARTHVLICAARLLWVYLFRCHEGTNPTAKRLDAFFALWFPPNRAGVVLGDTRLDAHVAMVHYTLFRQFEYAKALVLDLLRQPVLDNPHIVHQAELLAPTRMAIAIRAVARTLTCYLTGEPPAFALDTPPEHADPPPDAAPAFPRAEMATTYARFAELIGRIALICDYQVKDVNVLDERVPIARGSSIPLIDRVPIDRDVYVPRAHAAGAFTVAVAREQLPFLDLLRTCFDAWPLCAPASLSPQTLHTLLFRALYSAEPAVHRAATRALVRFAQQAPGAHGIIGAYIRWAFQQDGFMWELVAHAALLLPKMAQTVAVFTELLDVWWAQLRTHADPDALHTIDEIEACALYLLAAPWAPLRSHALTVLRLVALISALLLGPTKRAAAFLELPARECALVDPSAPAAQRTAASKWLAPDASADDAPRLLHLAESPDAAAELLWLDALPRMLQGYQREPRGEIVVTCVHTHIASRVRGLDGARSAPLVRDVWLAYTRVLCATAPENAHAALQLLVPSLRADDTPLRESAAGALAFISSQAYPALLDALEPLTDDSRAPLAHRVALARVLCASARHMHTAAATRLSRWISDALTFLERADSRHELDTYRLRRYFCGIVEHYATALGAAVPHELRRRLIALLATWHEINHAESTAPEIAARLTAAVAYCTDMRECERVMLLMRPELELLAQYTDSALGALALAPLTAADAPPIDPAPFFSWAATQFGGPAASRAATADSLRTLVRLNGADTTLLHMLLTHTYSVMHGDPSFFHVLADAHAECALALSPAEVTCVALAGLAHDARSARLRALRMLGCSTPAVDVASPSPGSYVHAQRALARTLAAEHTSIAGDVLTQGVVRLQHMRGAHAAAFAGALCPWAEATVLTDAAHAALAALTACSASGVLADLEARELWTALLSHDQNADMATLFFLSEVQRCAPGGADSTIRAAQLAMACIADMPARPRIFRRLCASMDPGLVVPAAECADLYPISPATAALLLAIELVRADIPPELPLLLHVLCIALDAAPPALRTRLVASGEQLLLALGAPPDAAAALSAPHHPQALVSALRPAAQTHLSGIAESWGSIALRWAALLPVRRMASYSFYVFRELLPPISTGMLTDMFVRLAGTVSDASSTRLQHFVIDVLDTLHIAVRAAAVPDEHVPEVFWTAAACLSTANEKEYARALALLDAVLARLDLSTDKACDALAQSRPAGWVTRPDDSLLALLVRGLRSTDQCDAALGILGRLVSAANFAAVDHVDRCVWLLHTVAMALPWWLEACAARLSGTTAANAELAAFLGERVAVLADAAHMPDVARVAASVGKARFRTSDDLVRQAVASVCAAAAFEHHTLVDMATTLLHLTFNPRDWVCLQALHALKVLFGLMAQRNLPLVPHGREMLVPLLRLLPLPLAPHALEVLDEPVLVPNDEQATGLNTNDLSLFGAPAASGWGIAAPHAEMDHSRANMNAVWRMCELAPGEPALSTSLSFVDEDERLSRDALGDDADMGALASQLSDLASFFTQDGEDGLRDLPATPTMPQESLTCPESHVAKILSRSTFGSRDSMLFAARRENNTSDADMSVLALDASFASSSPGIRSSTPAKSGAAPQLSDPFLTGSTLAPNALAPPIRHKMSESSLSDHEVPTTVQ